MKISLQTIHATNKRYTSAGNPAPGGLEALLERIGQQLGAVEDVQAVAPMYMGARVVRIMSLNPHPNADRLHVCLIDDGRAHAAVERDANGYVQVVCGAPNLYEGMTVVWLPPGTTVPVTYGTADTFTLEARPLRGVVSQGMLASPRELKVGDWHGGILDLKADDSIKPGTTFIEAYGLENDVVIDLENKMFTHRPDCFGFMGVARELEGIQGRAYKSPEWYRHDMPVPHPDAPELPLKVVNELPDLVPRFTTAVMSNITVGQTFFGMQLDLAKVGVRPISNIVDFTNFFMHETGQPLHAYDYDKVKALSGEATPVIQVRHPRSGEQVKLLNGKTITPRPEAIVIATDKQIIGIGGVMGGAETEVDENTKNIIIEAACFNMYSIRRTSMTHGLFTDAVARFNKGQSPLQTMPVLVKMINEVQNHAGGKLAGKVLDDLHVAEQLERGSVHPAVQTTAEFINQRLGSNLSVEQIATYLRNVEFNVEIAGQDLAFTAPFWRTDIELPEDIVEEVGRMHGYANLPATLPSRSVKPVELNPERVLRQKLRTVLQRAGANEVLTYSFVHGALMDRVGQDRTQAFELNNALSPDLQYYRLSLTPSLLEKVAPNIRAGYARFAIFEIGTAHVKGKLDTEGLPSEFGRLAYVYADSTSGKAAYYEAKHHADYVFEQLGVKDLVGYQPLQTEDLDQATRYYAPGRAATIMLNDHIIGYIGEYNQSVRRALKLPERTAGFELALAALQTVSGSTGYKALSRFPSTSQDLCLELPATVPYQELHSFLAKNLGKAAPKDITYQLAPVDIFQKDNDLKRVTLRITAVSHVRTLQTAEVSSLLNALAEAAQTAIGATRI